MPKKKRRFRVEIEAAVFVDAFDAASAHKKLAEAFAERQGLGRDVTGTGIVHLYDTRLAETAEPSRLSEAPDLSVGNLPG